MSTPVGLSPTELDGIGLTRDLFRLEYVEVKAELADALGTTFATELGWVYLLTLAKRDLRAARARTGGAMP